MTARLRLVVFSESIISDTTNPWAITVRAICQAFADAGHDVTHLEARGNFALYELLMMHGAEPLRWFNERYPLIRYRQYELASGWERVVWFGREIATADVVVAYPGAPQAIMEEVAAITSPRIVAFWPGATGEEGDLLPLWYAPAADPDLPGMEDNVRGHGKWADAGVDMDAGQRAERLAAQIDRLLTVRKAS